MRKKSGKSNQHYSMQTGFGLAEVLMALAVSSIGMLGYIQLEYKAVFNLYETNNRTAANILASDIIGRIEANYAATLTYFPPTSLAATPTYINRPNPTGSNTPQVITNANVTYWGDDTYTLTSPYHSVAAKTVTAGCTAGTTLAASNSSCYGVNNTYCTPSQMATNDVLEVACTAALPIALGGLPGPGKVYICFDQNNNPTNSLTTTPNATTAPTITCTPPTLPNAFSATFPPMYSIVIVWQKRDQTWASLTAYALPGFMN